MVTEYQDVTTYIQKYWGQVAFSADKKPTVQGRGRIMHIGAVPLSKPAIAPNDQYFAGTQFYWDSYFAILGLVAEGYTEIAKGMVENLCDLYDMFGLVPARNSTTSRGRTQPPFLTRMVWEVYEHGGADDKWLQTAMGVAAEEYQKVWCSGRRFLPKLGLSRYNPEHFAHWLTVYESGWDKSSRFAANPKSLVPVDLNAQLFVYEEDLYNWATQHAPDKAPAWQAAMEKRRARITQFFWDEQTGFFYDFDLRTGGRRPLKTLAGFYPLWAGAATPEQAKRCVENLGHFEHEFGLAATEKLPWKKRQWDYPNGWPPLQYIVISGLRRYGYNDHAARLTYKWLSLNSQLLHDTGKLWEKYDVVHGRVGLSGRYPTQPGFSWTCGVFSRLLADLEDL